jgi:hypothetical protein
MNTAKHPGTAGCIHISWTSLFTTRLSKEKWASWIGGFLCLAWWRPVAYLVFSSKARIEPDSLLPTDYAGFPIESKTVDFAVYLDSDDTTHDALRQLAARDPFITASWNHTYFPPLQKRPLAMSIGTKLTGRDWATAKIQMSIWMAAQLNKLEQLIAHDGGGLPGLPFLPVIVTQGHEW